MATVLIVEDDKNTRLLTEARLKNHYKVLCATDGKNALDVMTDSHVDLIVTDIMMPVMDGLTLLKTLRDRNIDTPVLLLTAKSAWDDKRVAFSLGTDDYMIKPIDYDELLWRIDALLRRSKISSENKIVLGNTTVDTRSYSVLHGDKIIDLPKKEFDLLFLLLSYPSRIFTYNEILDTIWGYGSESTEETVRVHINRLRNKLDYIDDFSISTVRGLGYKAEVKT